MNERCAQLAYPVLHYGLDLLRRRQRGEALDLLREQSMLKDLLLAEESATGAEDADAGFEGLVVPRPAHQRFIGLRYALVCWLDELFTTQSDWAEAWNEHKLEVELYGSNDRAWKFWEQARLAQTRATTDALEVYYLCVMLGFRGALASQPEEFAAWLSTVRRRLGQVAEREFDVGQETASTSTARPLFGASRLRQMALTAWVALLVLGPLTACYVVHRWGQ